MHEKVRSPKLLGKRGRAWSVKVLTETGTKSAGSDRPNGIPQILRSRPFKSSDSRRSHHFTPIFFFCGDSWTSPVACLPIAFIVPAPNSKKQACTSPISAFKQFTCSLEIGNLISPPTYAVLIVFDALQGCRQVCGRRW